MKIFINGVEKTGGLSGWKFTEKIGNPTSSTVQLVVGAGELPPVSGDVIEMKDDSDNVVFFGLVGVPKSQSFSSFFQPKIYTLNCTNGNSILARRIVNQSFVNKTITEIVQTLYSVYIADEGISLGTISDIPSPVFEVYNCKNMNLLKVLNELAGYINGAWQVTNERVFNFVALEDFPACSHEINRDTAVVAGLQTSMSDRDLRTNQIIDGAFITTDTQTEQSTVTEDWTGFFTSFPLVTQPRMFINSTEIPSEAIGVKGLDEEREGVLFLWAYDSSQIQKNPRYTGSIVLNVGDVVSIGYTGLAPIRYEIRDSSKVAELKERTGLSGIIDNVLVDGTIITKADAESKALSLLSLHGDQQRTVKCNASLSFALEHGFLASDFDLYTQWTFNLPEIDLVGDFVLTEKTISQENLAEDGSLFFNLTFTDRNFIQSYGEIISSLYRDVVKLSVRADETIIAVTQLKEKTTLKESVEVSSALGLWVAERMENGQIAQCLGTIVPNLIHGV